MSTKERITILLLAICIILINIKIIGIAKDIKELRKENQALREQYIFIYDYVWED